MIGPLHPRPSPGIATEFEFFVASLVAVCLFHGERARGRDRGRDQAGWLADDHRAITGVLVLCAPYRGGTARV